MSEQIAIIVSEFNGEITSQLLAGCLAHLSAAGIAETNITTTKVPGAIEIPLTAKWLAKKNFSIIICLGAVIRGETDHYDYVCQQVSSGCQQVMLEFEIPVIFGILTTHNLEQAYDRIGGKEGHKGKEAAEAALMMLQLKKNLVSHPLA